jgi:hypothetical protein
MPSQLGARLEDRRDLAEPVRGADRILMPMLFKHSQTARALWDLSPDKQAREVLMLVLTDPWGSAAGDFVQEELRDAACLRRRFDDLINEMIMPRRPKEPRALIELCDAFVRTDQLEQLRLRLGNVPDIGRARLRLHNQVRFVPERPDNYHLTDFAIEVSEPFATAVRDVAVECGFQIRDDPWLIRREGVREALAHLVEQHRDEGQPKPDFALCFQLRDRETIHLLEVSGGTPELGDGNLDGVGFAARGVVPQAHSFKIYLTHPDDLRTAFRVDRDHPLFNDLRNGHCEFLLPNDNGETFRRTFADLLGANRAVGEE